MESPKRRIPSVEPVEAGGIRYEVVRGARARGFAQNGGIVAATDIASGRELWTLEVYKTDYDAAEEADVQERFITAMRLSEDGTRILVDSENRKTYAIGLADGTVSRIEGVPARETPPGRRGP